MTDEVFKTVNEHPNYMISNLGRLLNIKRGRYLKGSYDRNGYKRYTLLTGDFQETKGAHIIVAEAFIPNPDNKPEVNHVDEVKDHNFVGNLEWSTKLENMWHSRFANAKTYRVRHPDGHEETFHNLSEFCREHDLNVANLHKGLTKGWSHKGFKLLDNV